MLTRAFNNGDNADKCICTALEREKEKRSARKRIEEMNERTNASRQPTFIRNKSQRNGKEMAKKRGLSSYKSGTSSNAYMSTSHRKILQSKEMFR